MATLNDLLNTLSETLGVDTDNIEIQFTDKGTKLVITVNKVDEEELFDEDYGQDLEFGNDSE